LQSQFHIIGVQRRLADWSFEKAQTWEDLLAAHEKWLLDYNHQRHMAHEARDDNCHSPAQVLGWQRGVQPEPERIYRAFSAIGETRILVNANIKLVESVQLSWWPSVFFAFFVCCSSRFTDQMSHLFF
jgi:hypothetical protein